MDVWLMRHGIAEDAAPSGGGDFARKLTDEGREKSRAMGRALAALEAGPDAIFSSPLVRALQTAEAVRAVLDGPEVVRWESLEPSADPRAATAALAGLRGMKRVCLVGHEPHLGRLASHLLTGSAAVRIEFKKTALLAVSFIGPPAAGKGTLVGFVAPGWVRRLAEVRGD
ncbi:MAG: phosphohistidine phosphatase SixA [Planctomycetes bacterium]|nr:phosphohistidine phosphatase SixA [Planctomycetota bacterium]